MAYSPPLIRAVGTVATGVGAISPGLPAGTVPGDLLIMVLETAAQAITASGWTTSHTAQETGNTRLTVLHRISVDGADATTTSDAGDHQIGRIIGIQRGTFDGVTNPLNVTAGSTQAIANTEPSVPTATTTRDNCLIVAATSGALPDSVSTTEYSGWTNANLTGVTERIDDTTASGDGGAIGAATGVLVTAGATGATTSTAVTSVERANITLAITPYLGPGTTLIHRIWVRRRKRRRRGRA